MYNCDCGECGICWQRTISESQKKRHQNRANIYTFIYVLINPLTNDVFYVGSTEHPKKRLSSHIRDSRKSLNHLHQTDKERYITDMLAAGTEPTMTVIEVTKLATALEREQYWINALWGQGYVLTNRLGVVSFGFKPLHEDFLNNPNL